MKTGGYLDLSRSITLEIIEVVQGDIFCKYKAKYMGENPLSISISQEGKQEQNVTARTNDIISIDTLNSFEGMRVGDKVRSYSYILNNYAKNPSNGIVVVLFGGEVFERG